MLPFSEARLLQGLDGVSGEVGNEVARCSCWDGETAESFSWCTDNVRPGEAAQGWYLHVALSKAVKRLSLSTDRLSFLGKTPLDVAAEPPLVEGGGRRRSARLCTE